MAAARPSGSEATRNADPGTSPERKLVCWQCGEASAPSFFCPHCGAVQSLPSDSNYSSLLGFEGLPDIDEGVLRDRYYELSRRLHPDRFQTESGQEQRVSLQATALLNEAFRTLKDVESRGRWWLERTGESLGRNNNQVPTALAAQVFEIQEKIAELGSANGEDRAALVEELEAIHENLTARRNEGKNDVVKLLKSWSREDDSASPKRTELKSLLSELSYLRTLTRDVRTAIEG